MTFEKFWKTAPENGSSWEEFYGKDSWEYPEAENLARKAFEDGQKEAVKSILYTLEQSDGDLDFFKYLLLNQFNAS